MLRLLPSAQARPLAVQADQRMVEAFCQLNSLPPLDEVRATALRLPLRRVTACGQIHNVKPRV